MTESESGFLSNWRHVIHAALHFSVLYGVTGRFLFYQAVFVIPPGEYYWKTDVIVVSVLLGGSLFFGFVLPSVFRLLRLRAPWIWIMVSGILAMLLALMVMTALNATPLCVGRDNGDGNNDLGMCMAYVFLAAIIFGSVYLFFLTISACIGHWVMKWQLRTEEQSS